jgi:hypothetical protein
MTEERLVLVLLEETRTRLVHVVRTIAARFLSSE